MKWNKCYNEARACDKLWDFLARRGDKRMKRREINEEKGGLT